MFAENITIKVSSNFGFLMEEKEVQDDPSSFFLFKKLEMSLSSGEYQNCGKISSFQVIVLQYARNLGLVNNEVNP